LDSSGAEPMVPAPQVSEDFLEILVIQWFNAITVKDCDDFQYYN
jgi:hypothetical protein